MVRRILRERIDSQGICPKSKIICQLEVESLESSSAILAYSQDSNSLVLIGEKALPTIEFSSFSQSGLYRSSEGWYLTENELESLVNSLLEGVLNKTGLPPKNIDFVSAVSDGYSGLKKPEDITRLDSRIENFCRDFLNTKTTKIRWSHPAISANEKKAEWIAHGSERLVEKALERSNSPSVFIDFSTFLSGLSVSRDKARVTNSLIIGRGAEVLDSLAQGHQEVDSSYGTLSDLPLGGGMEYLEEAEEMASRVANLMNISRVPSGKKKFGGIPLNTKRSYEENVKLVGCDVFGDDRKLDKVTEIGRRAVSYGEQTLRRLIERTYSRLVSEVIKTLFEEEALGSEPTICISGRKDITSSYHEKLIKEIKEMGLTNHLKSIYFVEKPETLGIPREDLVKLI